MIIHFDLDAFYCAVEEQLDPTLRDVPFVVAQKNCVATLSYAARALGLKKLMSVSESKALFPHIRTVNGESLAKYRRAGKELVKFVQEIVPNCAIERLGLEEMWIDLTELVDFNLTMFHQSGLMDVIQQHANEVVDFEQDDDGVNLYMTTNPDDEPYFCEDFMTVLPGKTVPPEFESSIREFSQNDDMIRVYIGTCIASIIQERIHSRIGYSCSVGVAQNKTLAKMVGSVNKPKGLTTLIPSYTQAFLDPLPISKIPYCGSKTVKAIRAELSVDGDDDTPTIEQVRVGFSQSELNTILPSLWDLIHGIDKNEVKMTPLVPSQVSIEDTRWWDPQDPNPNKMIKTLIHKITTSLVDQLLEDVIDVETGRWLGKPTTLRLTMRVPGMPNLKRKAKQIPAPQYVYKLCTLGLAEDKEEREVLIERLVEEYQRMLNSILHNTKPESIELINVAMTGIK